MAVPPTNQPLYPATLQQLLTGLIDYAGLFPPASLPLKTAVTLYTRYQTEPESWMLGRFIMPAARLSQLALPPDGEPLSLSILGRGGLTVDAFWEGLAADLTAVSQAVARYGQRLTADVFEVKLPPSLFDQPDEQATVAFVAELVERLTAERPMTLFLEMPLPPADPNWLAETRGLINGLARWQQAHQEKRGGAGFKLRCGGVQPADFPSAAQVALAVTACQAAAVPFKATAGLHHPIRHFNEGVQTPMHGFLNLFGGGVLAAANGLTAAQLEPILADENPAHFQFGDREFVWQGEQTYRATLDQIRQLRQTQFIAFGSCSFDEPREDLSQLVE